MTQEYTLTEIKIRGYHLDAYRHVNNARYLELMEEARWDYLDSVEALRFFDAENLAFVVVNININYKYPATQGDVLVIKTFPSKKGNTSWVFTQIGTLKGSEKEVFNADVTFVLIDSSTGKPVRVTSEMEKHLLPNL
ncbi:MAG: acyl-CoA thioesterase [Luteibaculum sp.]